MTSKEKYLEWMKQEKLSDMGVAAENIMPLREEDGVIFWERLLIADQNAVEMRKEDPAYN